MAKKLSRAKQLRLELSKEKEQNKLKRAKFSCDCMHRNSKGLLTKWKDEEHTTLKCKECGKKIPLTMYRDKEEDEIKASVKKRFKAIDEILDHLKIFIDPKWDGDAKIRKEIAKTQFRLKRLKKPALSVIGDNLKVNKKNKKRRKKKGGSSGLLGGGRSFR